MYCRSKITESSVKCLNELLFEFKKSIICFSFSLSFKNFQRRILSFNRSETLRVSEPGRANQIAKMQGRPE